MNHTHPDLENYSHSELSTDYVVQYSYFDFAENDFLFLNKDYEERRVGNIMCSAAHLICERYLKHIIYVYCQSIDKTSILRTHSLAQLADFIKENVLEFECSWDDITKIDSYYSMQYPNDNSHMANKNDVDVCWNAVLRTRDAVLDFIAQNTPEQAYDVSRSDTVVKVLKEFDCDK